MFYFIPYYIYALWKIYFPLRENYFSLNEKYFGQRYTIFKISRYICGTKSKMGLLKD